ncbi:shikimate dehydrogenase [Chloroflexota bacterium]
MNITGKTKVCGIIGDPVTHSMSPAMQNAGFQAANLDYVYVALPVRGDSVVRCAEAVRTLQIRGLNVTVPHKVAIMPTLDEIDPLAQHIGAVNTIVNEDGKLTGYNTDGPGFMRALAQAGLNVTGKAVVVLGAGGAARAVAYSLAEAGAQIAILNRSVERAETLARDISIGRTEHEHVSYAPLEHACLRERLAAADVLVNTTSVGMSPDTDSTPCPEDLLRENLAVCDIVYHPLRTRLLREAEAVGATIIGGAEMLIHQGAQAFELWTGVPAPVEVMRRAVMERLACAAR